MRYAMMIELDKCIGCQACVTACKERWDSGPDAARDWVMTFTHGHADEGNLGVTFYPGLCNHCDDHPCTADCPTGATYKTVRGVVVVDPDVCIGCGNCVPNCPYGARHADARKGIVEKCNFCAPYVERGEAPACVATCLAECRHFGDLDDPRSELRQLIETRRAEPLVTNAIDVGPKVYYAPPELRLQVLAQGVVHRYGSTLFTETYQHVSRPVARWFVAPVVLATGVAGVLANLRQRLLERRQRVLAESSTERPPELESSPGAEPPPDAEDEAAAAVEAEVVPRHAAGMRFLHWFNLVSWIFLLTTGTALMSTHGFALFGTRFPEWLASALGGKANMIWLHVAWGALWALIIVPLFLYFKRGGLEALHELWPSGDDLRWLVIKPLVMVGLKPHSALPPQDKYNFGQKLFAISALVGTAVIIVTGVIMAFHLGPAPVVRAAIMVHKLAVMLALLGIAVHVTMAAILVEERPALWSMIVGYIDRRHAASHNAKWLAQLEERRRDS